VLCAAVSEEQWQVDSARQTAGEVEGGWSSRAHLLTDGPDAGHPCRVYAAQALWLSGCISLSLLLLSNK